MTAPPVPTKRQCPWRPPAEITESQATHPLSRVTFPNGTVGWLVSGYEMARSVLRDARFSNKAHDYVYFDRPPVEIPAMHPASLITTDPPEHGAYRRLLTGAFTTRRVQQLRPQIEQIVDKCLDAVERSSRPVDLMKVLAFPVPSHTISELLGVPDTDHSEFERTAAATMRLDISLENAILADMRFTAYLRALVATKRAEPADDLLSALIKSSVDEPMLDDETLVTFAKVLLIAGHETTACMIGLGTTMLLENPDQLARLRADPELVGPAVEELLRHMALLHLGMQRTAREDIEVGGHLIRKGEFVIIHIAAANFDPVLSSEPFEFDIARRPSAHLTFGFGPHQCTGQQLARLELQIVFTKLFQRFPTLRLAVPFEELRFRDKMTMYGVYELPVTW